MEESESENLEIAHAVTLNKVIQCLPTLTNLMDIHFNEYLSEHFKYNTDYTKDSNLELLIEFLKDNGKFPTLMHVACMYNLEDTFCLLMEKANGLKEITIKNEYGNTPLDIVRDQGHIKLENLINDYQENDLKSQNFEAARNSLFFKRKDYKIQEKINIVEALSGSDTDITDGLSYNNINENEENKIDKNDDKDNNDRPVPARIKKNFVHYENIIQDNSVVEDLNDLTLNDNEYIKYGPKDKPSQEDLVNILKEDYISYDPGAIRASIKSSSLEIENKPIIPPKKLGQKNIEEEPTQIEDENNDKIQLEENKDKPEYLEIELDENVDPTIYKIVDLDESKKEELIKKQKSSSSDNLSKTLMTISNSNTELDNALNFIDKELLQMMDDHENNVDTISQLMDIFEHWLKRIKDEEKSKERRPSIFDRIDRIIGKKKYKGSSSTPDLIQNEPGGGSGSKSKKGLKKYSRPKNEMINSLKSSGSGSEGQSPSIRNDSIPEDYHNEQISNVFFPDSISEDKFFNYNENNLKSPTRQSLSQIPRENEKEKELFNYEIPQRPPRPLPVLNFSDFNSPPALPPKPVSFNSKLE